jgi:hypothetical protein
MTVGALPGDGQLEPQRLLWFDVATGKALG